MKQITLLRLKKTAKYSFYAGLVVGLFFIIKFISDVKDMDIDNPIYYIMILILITSLTGAIVVFFWSLSLLLWFIYFMVKRFGTIDPDEKGYVILDKESLEKQK